MADVTVKAYAELIHTPLYGQMRILREQKYPNQTDGQFKMPYYQPAIRHIRRYYRSGNNPVHLPQTAQQVTGCGTQEARIAHNLRTINAFRNGDQFDRTFSLSNSETHHAVLNDVDIRATADLVVSENAGQVPLYLIYDCREQCPENEIIRTTVELFHYVLEQNDIDIPIRNVEYVCLDSERSSPMEYAPAANHQPRDCDCRSDWRNVGCDLIERLPPLMLLFVG